MFDPYYGTVQRILSTSSWARPSRPTTRSRSAASVRPKPKPTVRRSRPKDALDLEIERAGRALRAAKVLGKRYVTPRSARAKRWGKRMQFLDQVAREASRPYRGPFNGPW